MNFNEYVPLAVRTESRIEKINFDRDALINLLKAFVAVGTMLDLMKKNVFYGKPISQEKWNDCFQVLDQSTRALKFSNNVPALLRVNEIELDTRAFHSFVGIATESTELIEALLKVLVEGKSLDKVNVSEELGDISWYMAIAADALVLDLEKGLSINIEKLRKRFPDKFSQERAINRDIDTERIILEKI